MKVWKAPGLVLQFPQAAHVVYPVVVFLDMAEKHGGVGSKAQLVGGPVDLDPLVRVRLARADLFPHLGMENLGAPARHGIQTRFFKGAKGLPGSLG